MKIALAVFLSCAAALAQNDIRGFPVCRGASTARTWKPRPMRSPTPKRLRSYMEKMAAEPHIAGSPASKAVADYAAGLLRSWGLGRCHRRVRGAVALPEGALAGDDGAHEVSSPNSRSPAFPRTRIRATRTRYRRITPIAAAAMLPGKLSTSTTAFPPTMSSLRSSIST